MIYGNLLSYSSGSKGKVWLYGRASPWLSSGARSSQDFPQFFIEGYTTASNPPVTYYSSLSTTGNELAPLAMSPGDLIYAEFTIIGGATLTRAQIIAQGGYSSIGGVWAYQSAVRFWWRYYGSTVYAWSTRWVSNGRSHFGFSSIRSSNIDKWYDHNARFNVGIASVGYESVLAPKTLGGFANYGYGAATTEVPRDQCAIALRKFVWQPNTAIVPAGTIEVTDTSAYQPASGVQKVKQYVQPIIGAGRSQYSQPSITLQEYESTYWNDTIVTGP